MVYGQLSNSQFSIVDFPGVPRQVTAYILTPGEPRNLATETINVNGNVLQWTSHQAYPDIQGYETTLPIQIPAYSLFFLVLNQSDECPQEWLSYDSSTNLKKCVNFVNSSQPMFSAKFISTTLAGRNSSLLQINNEFENNET